MNRHNPNGVSVGRSGMRVLSGAAGVGSYDTITAQRRLGSGQRFDAFSPTEDAAYTVALRCGIWPLPTADGGSSNGRTADSDSASLGSNPSPPAS